jgi:glycosyltransferase involved in cell wall biosynthesis
MAQLSILMPCYNEVATIATVLRGVSSLDLRRFGLDKEIIVVDDGSCDGTAARIEAMLASLPTVRLLRHARNRGKGAAIRTALAAARGEWCIIQDCDLEYSLDDYPALIRPLLAGAPVVYGSRFLRCAWPSGMALQNLVGNLALTSTANLLFGAGITDEATAYKAFRTSLLLGLDLRCERFEFCPEVTAKLALRRVRIVEVPISYRGRSKHSGKKVRWTDGVEAMATLVRHWRAQHAPPLAGADR